MKVLIDTESKYFRILDPVTIQDLTEFVNKHGFGDYIMRFEDEIHIPSVWEVKPTPNPTCVTTSTNPDDYQWVNSPLVGSLNASKDDPDDELDTRP